MTYGIRFKNNSDVVTVDSEYSRLVVVAKGVLVGSSSTSSGLYQPFPFTITTTEPPLVFIRPNQSCSIAACNSYGSPGNWQGFLLYSNVGIVTTFNWFCTSFAPTPTGRFGFRVWDSSAKLLFDSGTPYARFTRAISNWTYLGAVSIGQGTKRYTWTSYSPINTGDYMLINNIAMDMAGVVSRQGQMVAVWDYQNDRLLMQADGVDLPGALYITVIFALAV